MQLTGKHWDGVSRCYGTCLHLVSQSRITVNRYTRQPALLPSVHTHTHILTHTHTLYCYFSLCKQCECVCVCVGGGGGETDRRTEIETEG